LLIKSDPVGRQWLMPIILLRRQRSGGLRFEASPGQIVHKTLSRKNPAQNRAGKVA
jgi:hypothetical protein